MDKVRIGMIGKGFAARLHLDSIAGLRGLKAECGLCLKKARCWRFCEHLRHSRYYDDYRRLLERKDIDIIDLCIPTDLHEQFCIETAQAGKHLVCEKPLTGYFGKDRPEEKVGFAVRKALMLQETEESVRTCSPGSRSKSSEIHVRGKLGVRSTFRQTQETDAGESRHNP